MNEFDKLLKQATKAVLDEGYSEKEAQKLRCLISDSFANFLAEKYEKNDLYYKRRREYLNLCEKTFCCFPFNAPLITLEKRQPYEKRYDYENII